ncbi:MAG: ammonium transporter [Desulfovibrionaceae bacterium]
MSPVDNAFILICSALVLFMTPGLALFYGGLVRSKNVLSSIMHSFFAMGLATVLWAVIGYSLAFGPSVGGVIGGLDHLFLRGVPLDDGSALSPMCFMIFQCMFAVITPALISGAYAERMKFSGYMIFTALWLLVVYCPMAHMVWGGGIMAQMGALDFAGGAVVHMSSGAAALACAIFLGKRKGYGKEPFIPHNLPMTLTGAGILWFGWFGFNAGSALAADAVAVNAFATTHMATGAALVTWIIAEWLHSGKPTTLGAASGLLAGLVAITPAAGFVSVQDSLIIGGLAGFICYGGIMLKNKFGYDDALDVVGIHGVGGTWGALATGLFASGIVKFDGVPQLGLFYGNPEQLWIQFKSVVITWVFCFVASAVLFKIVDKIVGMRADAESEVRGLDVTQHSEAGYQL